MTEHELSKDIPEDMHNTELKNALLWTLQESKKMRKRWLSRSRISREIIDHIIDRAHRIEDSDNWLCGLPQGENLSWINWHTSYGRYTDIDWPRYFQLKSKGKEGLNGEEREEIQDIRECLRLTIDPVAVWQWAYSYLVFMICNKGTQLYPRFDEMVRYNPQLQVSEEDEEVPF